MVINDIGTHLKLLNKNCLQNQVDSFRPIEIHKLENKKDKYFKRLIKEGLQVAKRNYLYLASLREDFLIEISKDESPSLYRRYNNCVSKLEFLKNH